MTFVPIGKLGCSLALALCAVPTWALSAEVATTNLASVLCYTLAADPADKQKPAAYAGVPSASVTDAAVTACGVATQSEPENVQLQYLYGRANLALGYFSVALPELTKAADKGYAAAERALGNIYAEGLGVARDANMALEHYIKANDLGDPTGLVGALARMIDNQVITPEVANLLLKAGLAGSGAAWSMLGELDSNRVESIPRSAIENALMLGLAAGSDTAGVELGRFYERHDNPTAVAAVFEMMAKRGSREAMLALSERASGTEKLTLLQKAADLGEPKAMYVLAKAYKDGTDGVAADQEAYRSWLLKAAQGRYTSAMADLGYEFFNGNPPDYEAARNWFEKAADRGNARASLGLAYIYEAGNGVPVDLKEALDHYTAAIEAGEGMYARFYRSRIEDRAGPLYAPEASATDLLAANPKGPAGDAAAAGLTGYSAGTLKALQQKLLASGHYKGKVDGDPGPGTLRALLAYWGG